jgi:hypothetical protein
MPTTMLVALVVISTVILAMRRSRRGPRVTQIDRTVIKDKDGRDG